MGWVFDDNENRHWNDDPRHSWGDDSDGDDFLGRDDEPQSWDEDDEYALDPECQSCGQLKCEECDTCIHCEAALDAKNPCIDCRTELESLIQCFRCHRNFCACRLGNSKLSVSACTHLRPFENRGLICRECYLNYQKWDPAIRLDKAQENQVESKSQTAVGGQYRPSSVKAELNGEVRMMTEELKKLRAEKLVLENREKELRNLILSQLGPEDCVGTVEGRTVIAVLTQNRVFFDSKKLRTEHPALAARYVENRQSIVLKTF